MRAGTAKRDAQCVSAEEAFRLLGIDRTTGYRAIKDDTFPLPVIRVGRLLKVPTAALHRLLDPDPSTMTAPTPMAPLPEVVDSASGPHRRPPSEPPARRRAGS